MAVRVRGNLASMQPTLPDGVTVNPLFNEIVYMKIRGYDFFVRPNGFAIRQIDDFKDFDIPRMLVFIENGCRVENYPCWIRLNETKWNTEDVPDYMPNYQQGDPPATVKWKDWMNATNTPTVVPNQSGDPIYYVQTSGSDNSHVDGDTIKLLNDAGYGLRSEHQMQNIVSS